MSVSSWLVTALALRPPGHILAHQIERPTTTPGRAALEILARARKAPRSLKTRTVCPSRIPRGAAALGGGERGRGRERAPPPPSRSDRSSHFPDGVGKPPSAKGTWGSGRL